MTQEPTTERVEPTQDEPLPNGGAYAMVFYQDVDGSPVPKTQALRAEVFEYTVENAPIAMTIIELRGTPATAQLGDEGDRSGKGVGSMPTQLPGD